MDGSLAEEAVTLRDGSRVFVRPVRPDDKELFVRGWQRFGEESRYRRFMGAKGGLTRRDLAYFTEVDHIDHEALGALDADTGEGVGVARYIRLGPGSPVAEAAVAVVDDWQSRGLGGELLRRLTIRARENGVDRFHASLFAYNKGMLALFGSLGDMTIRRGGGIDEIQIDVELSCESGDCLQQALKAAAEGQVELRPQAAETGG
jgi:GNAT superfamily N-acetyltransferase